jgi:hypothetical protein
MVDQFENKIAGGRWYVVKCVHFVDELAHGYDPQTSRCVQFWTVFTLAGGSLIGTGGALLSLRGEF